MKFNYQNEKMIAKYVLLIGLFHRVYSSYNTFGFMKTYYVPFESTPPKINVLHTQEGIGDLFSIMNGVLLRSQQPSRPQQLIKSQLSNPQLTKSQQSNPQISNLHLKNRQINNLQPRKSQPLKSNVKLKNNNRDNNLSYKITNIEPFGSNNNNLVYRTLKVSPQQAQLQQYNIIQRLKEEAVERLKQQQALEKLQQQTIERLRQQAMEKLKQQIADNLNKKQTHLFNLKESVKKKRQEYQKRNSEVWERIVKQRGIHIQRRFYEHALHDNDDYDNDDEDN